MRHNLIVILSSLFLIATAVALLLLGIVLLGYVNELLLMATQIIVLIVIVIAGVGLFEARIFQYAFGWLRRLFIGRN